MIHRKYHILSSAIVALALFPLGCSATGARSDYAPLTSEKAHPLANDDARAATIFDDRLEFPLASQNWLAGITAGDVLVSDLDAGFLRRVNSLETASDKVIVYTEDAALTDIVEQGETETTVDFGSLQPALAHAYPGYWPETVPGGPISFDNEDLTGKVISLGDGVTATITKGTFSFKPSLDVRLAFQHWKLAEARAIATGTFASDMQIEIEGAAQVNTKHEVTLLNSELFDVPLPPIGAIPIACSGRFVLKAGFEFDAQGQVHVTFGQTFDFDGSLGFKYDPVNEFETVNSFEPRWTPQGPELGANVDVKATGYLVGSVELGFYSVSKKLGKAAVEISAKPSLLFHYASADPAPGWSLAGALRVDVTPSLQVLGFNVLNKTLNLYSNENNPKPLLPAAGSNEPAPINIGTCSDGMEDGVESAVDCGGQCPNACGNGVGCVTDNDCVPGVCVNGECTGASCENNVQDAGETGIDCGGPCPACTGGTCKDASDCVGTNCVNGICEEPLSCQDGVQNSTETGIDCGGPCQACGDWAYNCADGVQNGDETNIDCGGSCPPCAAGSGGGTCDGTGNCNTCATCAEQGACAAVTNACSANSDCGQLASCFYACADVTCQNDCITAYPNGASDFTVYDTCVTCTECYSDCQGAAVCN